MIVGSHGNGYYSVCDGERIVPAPSGAMVWHESELLEVSNG